MGNKKQVKKPKFRDPSCLEGIAGTNGWSLFKAPLRVDLNRRPGMAAMEVSVCSYFLGILKLSYIFFSPNIIWLSIAAGLYYKFPLEMDKAKEGFAVDWILKRLSINMALVMSYFGFWHVCLYIFKFGSRKFKPESRPGCMRILHNIFYCALGVVQWTATEAIFTRLYATGKLPYISDADMFASNENIARMVLGAMLIPIIRDFHFYFAHRMIHYKCLFNFVHSLHHRNTDIEPFSGLTMHPIEHLYYYSCYLASLYLYLSPFHMYWAGVHALISPAASHSGWEDNLQSDQYHYLHHAMFECNYGTEGLPLDTWFGTFREKIGKSEKYEGQYRGESSVSSK